MGVDYWAQNKVSFFRSHEKLKHFQQKQKLSIMNKLLINDWILIRKSKKPTVKYMFLKRKERKTMMTDATVLHISTD